MTVKFPAAWRRDAYRTRQDTEQAAWLARISGDPDFERQEMVRLIYAGKRGQMPAVAPIANSCASWGARARPVAIRLGHVGIPPCRARAAGSMLPPPQGTAAKALEVTQIISEGIAMLRGARKDKQLVTRGLAGAAPADRGRACARGAPCAPRSRHHHGDLPAGMGPDRPADRPDLPIAAVPRAPSAPGAAMPRTSTGCSSIRA